MRKRIILLLIVLSFTFSGQTATPDISLSPWHIPVKDKTIYTGIALANGRIGIMPSKSLFKVESIILNNVYDKESELGVSKLLKGINFANLHMVIDGDTVKEETISGWQQVLDMKNASLSTSFRFKNKAEIIYTIYALRGMPYCGMIDVSVRALSAVQICVAGEISSPSEYREPGSTFRILKDNEIKMPLLQTTAKSPFGKHLLATTAGFVFDHDFPELHHSLRSEYQHQLSFLRTLVKNEIYSFAWAGAVCTTQDFQDPQNESERMVIFMMRGNKKNVISQHKKMWDELWQGDIVVEGDLTAQRDIRLALYHLYAFSAGNTDLSVAPMGLSSLNYNGHIFWDTELWMFPPLLVFNQDIARSLLNYRVQRLEKAKQKAVNYGYKGAMFPWESDDTGEEATPSWALTGTFEHHITADVGIACWNYFRVTHDTEWLNSTGFPIIREVADFWVSRAKKNEDGSWSIHNVVGANEFAPNVDDNAFTNGSAKTILGYAVEAAIVLGFEAKPEWKEVAAGLRFHYFDNGIMKEHSHYQGEIIKQADVNLLAYPLDVVTDREAIRKDLQYYETRIADEGPAMGYSILSILYARMGDRKKAYELFKRAYEPNKRPPFGALAESALSNNPYFATGAGGMLQAVIFGFGGIHLTRNGLEQINPCLPEKWIKLELKGIGPQKKNYVIK